MFSYPSIPPQIFREIGAHERVAASQSTINLKPRLLKSPFLNRSNLFETGMHEFFHAFDEASSHISTKMYSKNPFAMLWSEARANQFAYGGSLSDGLSFAMENGYLDTALERFQSALNYSGFFPAFCCDLSNKFRRRAQAVPLL